MTDQPVLIDSMRLAFEAFQACRHPGPYTSGFLDLAGRVLLRVRQDRDLVVEVPNAWFSWLQHGNEFCHAVSDQREADSLNDLPEAGLRLLAVLELATSELSALWASGQKAPVRSLGYAMHNIPHFVRCSAEFDPKLFGFCFRIAAFHWAAYSAELQQALCDLAGCSRDHAEKLVYAPEFAIKMFSDA